MSSPLTAHEWQSWAAQACMNSHHFYSKTKGKKYETAFQCFWFYSWPFSGSLCLAQTDQPTITERLQGLYIKSARPRVPAGQLARLCTIPHRGAPGFKSVKREPRTGWTWGHYTHEGLRDSFLDRPHSRTAGQRIFTTIISRLTGGDI